MNLKIPSLLIQRIFKYLCSTFVFIILGIPLSCLFVPFGVYRLFVNTVVIRFYSKIDKLLSCGSAGMGSDDLYNKPCFTLLLLFILEGTVDIEKLRDAVKSKLVDEKDVFGKSMRPELQQYITNFWGFTAWKWEPNFNIEDHVRIYEGVHRNAFQNENLVHDKSKITEIANELSFKPFERKKSPWVMHVIHNFRETGSPDEPIKTAMILQSHHGFADGISTFRTFLTDLKDRDEAYAEITKQPLSKTKKPLLDKIGKAVDLFFSAPYDLIRETILSADFPSKLKVPENRLLRSLNIGYSQSMPPLTYFKKLRIRHNVTFTAVVLECFTAALRKFTIEAGLEVPDLIQTGYLLPVPGHPNNMTNHLTLIYIGLPLRTSNPIKRLTIIEKNVRRAKDSAMPTAMFHVPHLIGWLPAKILHSIFKSNATAGVSNLAGPPKEMLITGHRVIGVGPCGGFQKGSCGIVLACMTYIETLHLVFAINDGIVSSTKLPATKLFDYFLEEAQLLMALAPATEV